MKWFAFLTVLACSATAGYAQESLRNTGNLRVFSSDALGFHHSLVNDGNLETSDSFIGFYGRNLSEVKGAFSPIFNNLTIDTEIALSLQLPIAVTGLLNFDNGDIWGSAPAHYVQFSQSASHSGGHSLSKIIGPAVATDKTSMVLPIGDINHLRPLAFSSSHPVSIRCEYLNGEHSDAYSDISGLRPSTSLEAGLESIVDDEIWLLDTQSQVQITLFTHSSSRLENAAIDLDQVVLAGWNSSQGRWENLGRAGSAGTLESGWVQSEPVEGSLYDALAFGVVGTTDSATSARHFLITPNGDGINDHLIMQGFIQHGLSRMMIFDRNGVKVYEKDAYENDFGGNANRGIRIGSSNPLPEGLYYYIFIPNKLVSENITGYFYLERS